MGLRIVLVSCLAALPFLVAAGCSSGPTDVCDLVLFCYCGDGTMQTAGCPNGSCEGACTDHGGYDGGRPPAGDGGDGGDGG
jgi:hypothetical protein